MPMPPAKTTSPKECPRVSTIGPCRAASKSRSPRRWSAERSRAKAASSPTRRLLRQPAKLRPGAIGASFVFAAMLDPKLLRSDPGAVAANLARRGFKLDVERLGALEEARKKWQVRADELRNERNVHAK